MVLLLEGRQVGWTKSMGNLESDEQNSFTGPALIAVFFLKTEAAILHKYVCIIIIIIIIINSDYNP